MATPDELDRLRDELDEWRRRAEVAEAVAVERLARAETAERALRTAEAAVGGRSAAQPAPRPPGDVHDLPPGPAAETPKRPASLVERWRRYTDTIN